MENYNQYFKGKEDQLEITDAVRLQEILAIVRILTGDGEALLNEVSQMPPAARENFGFLRGKTYFNYLTDEKEATFQILMGFIDEFPNSDHIVEAKHMAAITAHRQGASLIHQAEGLRSPEDQAQASELKRCGKNYLEQFRQLCGQGLLDDRSHLIESDILDLREDILMSYYLESNFTKLAEVAISYSSGANVGTCLWSLGKTYEGIAYCLKKPQEFYRAINAWEDMIAENEVVTKQNADILSLAILWRVRIAEEMGDFDRLDILIAKVKKDLPAAKYSKQITKGYGDSY